MAYSKEDIDNIFDEVCIRVENGEAIRDILKDKNLPSSSTFYDWLENDTEKSKRYARAKELWAESQAAEILRIADDSTNDTIYTEKGEIENKEWVNRSKLRVDTRKWLMSKMYPKKYGDKIDLTTDNKPINTNIIGFRFTDKGHTDDENTEKGA